MKPFPIKGDVKEYAWGTNDYITSLTGIRREGPISEYWLGTHFLGEAKTKEGTLLSEAIGHRLSFLFKVLSIATPLAIQCHPSKAQAIEGFQKEELLSLDDDKRNYPDDNEKTEAVIALTDFTGMYGFRSLDEIKANLKRFVPTLYQAAKDVGSMEELFPKIFFLSEMTTRTVLAELHERVKEYRGGGLLLSKEELCEWLLSLYPEDICCVSPLLMNVMHLKANDSLFISAGVVHAYCKGNCLEIMTSSDNMARLGLTKRHIDIPEFQKIAESHSLEPRFVEQHGDGGFYSYAFPAELFSFVRLEDGNHHLPPRNDGILFVVDGSSTVRFGEEETTLTKGEAFYVDEESEVTVQVKGKAFFSYSGGAG